MALLEVRDLCVEIAEKQIIKELNLVIEPGSVHAIMGPNGAGKSTLGYALAGHHAYKVTKGDILLNGQSVLELEPEERSLAGVFFSLQHPIEIPGVPISAFLKAAVNAHRKHAGKKEIDAIAFAKMLRQKASHLNISVDVLKRFLNVGFSGGEKKSLEALQIAMLEPRMVVLDETDSGLDIDALRVVAESIGKIRSADRSFIMITHYHRMQKHFVPDIVHVMVDGRIVETGSKELAEQLEDEGYVRFLPAQ